MSKRPHSPLPAEDEQQPRVQPDAPADPSQVQDMIRVGQKFKRGVGKGNPGGVSVTCVGFRNIDVTSGSGNKINGIKATTLSPMKLGPVKDPTGLNGGDCLIFECYYQFSKMWKCENHFTMGTNGMEPTPKWFAFRKKGFQLTKGKRRPFPVKTHGFPDIGYYNGQFMSYIEGRKKVYVPVYGDLIDELPIMDELEKLVKSGQNVLFIDGDGPDREEYPNGMPMTPENWSKRLNDKTKMMGHGDVCAKKLAMRCFPHLQFSDA